MGSLRKQQAVSAKKPYVTPEVWQYRLKKLQCRQINKQIRRRLATEALHQVFKAWTHSATTSDLAQFFNYGTSLRCSQVKAFLGFCKYRKMMRSQLQQSKSTFLKQRLSQLPENSAAADILKELKPFIGPTNPRKQKKATLPMVHNADDQPCTLPTEALAVWVDFFRDMEGGSRVTEAQLRTQWIDNLQSFRQTAFQLSMEEVPTLTDMELACRRVACKKATGPDKVPGEVCRFHPELLAPVTYTQMLKLVLHGQEPLLFKGGLLVPAYTGSIPLGLCWFRRTSARSSIAASDSTKQMHTKSIYRANSSAAEGRYRCSSPCIRREHSWEELENSTCPRDCSSSTLQRRFIAYSGRSPWEAHPQTSCWAMSSTSWSCLWTQCNNYMKS